MAPVAVPTMDSLKLDDPKVDSEKKPEVVNDEEGDDDDEEDGEGEGGETAATGGMYFNTNTCMIYTSHEPKSD